MGWNGFGAEIVEVGLTFVGAEPQPTTNTTITVMHIRRRSAITINHPQNLGLSTAHPYTSTPLFHNHDLIFLVGDDAKELERLFACILIRMNYAFGDENHIPCFDVVRLLADGDGRFAT